MRLTRLLLAVLLVLVIGRIAASQDVSSGNDSSASPRSDYRRSFTVAGDSTGAPLQTGLPGVHTTKRQQVEPSPADNLCLTMHTFQVARDEARADATHLVAERTCTPAQRFQTKSAIGVPAERK